ncbi:MAG: hypothetical protein ACE5H7_10580 [Acidiferrobacterales bacterium]
MKVHVRLNLYIVTALFLLWGVALFMGPEEIQPLLSKGPYDPAVTGMLGASLFAFALLFLMAALNPTKALIHVSVIALGLLSLVAFFQMFISSGMPQNPATFFSLLINLSIGLILFFSVLQLSTPSPTGTRAIGRSRVQTRRKAQASRRTKARKTSRPAGRAAGRKKVAKKTSRKTKRKADTRRKRR